ncbi:glycosyltransferase family 2 protein [Infirmifilum lucidum]|uniref:Glycosyltransferase family 2 protein n=1 Tax=Infirmifilum lucidum TaxID=2776706 RepID=A0A7L9FJW3_9CREN|nr:glycosyltransferase family 2 protein [Infirmifilum lucidum]QOJ79303.1 glycosyltransferase family 2 protein [Infirmifilum lucidum]
MMVKSPDTYTLKISLSSVCNADCLDEIILVTPFPEKFIWVEEVCPKARLVKDPGCGIGIARNYGIASSRNEIVAFVDPDAVVGENHFCTILKTFDDPSVGLVDVISTFSPKSFKNYTKVQLLENFVWKYGRVAQLRSENVIYAGGTFMALRKSLWKEVGGFWKYPPYGSDDMDFSYRVYKKGYKCKRIRVHGSFHIPRPTLRELFREQYGWGKGFAILLLKYNQEKEFWLSLRYSKILYNIIPSCYWFLIPVLRAIAAPIGGLVNSIRLGNMSFLPFWVFRRYAFLLGFIRGLHDYMLFTKLSRNKASLCAKIRHS